MKALIGFVSLAFGAALVALIVKIQSDPFALTSHTLAAAEPPAPVAGQPAPVEKPHIVTLAAVTITGHISSHLLHKQRAVVATRPKAPPAEPTVKVIPAPCVDGQYRKLEAHRGVRLTCPH